MSPARRGVARIAFIALYGLSLLGGLAHHIERIPSDGVEAAVGLFVALPLCLLAARWVLDIVIPWLAANISDRDARE